jgi:hypothetical protein
MKICPIVEGDGELYAIRDLINRIAREFHREDSWVDVLRPILRPRDRLLRTDDFERAIEAASIKLNGGGGVLVLLDSDDECPATLASRLLERANVVCGHLQLPLSVVFAHREYEAWFLASAASLANQAVVPETMTNQPLPEKIRGAKERLAQMLGRKYRETQDQPAFTNQFDLHLARANAPSFDKLCRDLGKMFVQLEV